jgi:phosphohistidine phosphatase
MDLILWRHADAEDVGPQGDLSRRLTKKGRRQAERMARWLDARLEGDWRIVCSPAQRALETVEPLGREFEVSEEVSTSASARSVLQEAGWPEGGRVIVVGHQPTLGEVASRLLGAGSGEFSVRKGAILWFVRRKREGADEVVLKTVLDPESIEE